MKGGRSSKFTFSERLGKKIFMVNFHHPVSNIVPSSAHIKTKTKEIVRISLNYLILRFTDTHKVRITRQTDCLIQGCSFRACRFFFLQLIK